MLNYEVSKINAKGNVTFKVLFVGRTILSVDVYFVCILTTPCCKMFCRNSEPCADTPELGRPRVDVQKDLMRWDLTDEMQSDHLVTA